MRSILIVMLMWGSLAYGAERQLAFQSYDVDSGMLRMQLITPSVQGELILQTGTTVELLDGVALENLFTIMVRVPCDKLSNNASVLWSTAESPVIEARIPPQTCQPVTQSVQVTNEQGICKIQTHGATLWRVATEFSARNHATIYQNIYAIFLVNRAKFKDDDIHVLRATELVCPSDRIVFGISSQQAKRIFTETLELKSNLK